MRNKLTVFIACYSKTEPHILENVVDSIRAQGIEPIVDYDERNTAIRWTEEIEKCKTPYLHLAHHDDIYLGGFYEKTIGYLDTHPEATAVFTMDYIVGLDGNREPTVTTLPIPEQDSYDFERILNSMIRHGNFLRCPSFVCRVDKVRGLKFPTEIKSAVDTAFWFRVLNRGPIGIINEPLIRYRRGGDTDQNIRGTYKEYDHLFALESAVDIRPHSLDWDTRINLGKYCTERDWRKESDYAKKRIEKAKECTFHVCHEPPDSAGTGVLLAERVRECNRGDAGVVAYYVFPHPEGNQKGGEVYRGVPILQIHPSGFQNLVDEYKPTLVEYHHLWRWNEDILDVRTDARKEFWGHDAQTICVMLHLFDGEGACDGPTTETGEVRCEQVCGVSADEVERKNIYLRSKMREMDQVIANSAYTKGFLDKHLGTDAIVVEPIPPPLPYYRKRKVIGYFGGYYPVKGFHILLKAMDYVKWAQLIMFTNFPEAALDGRRLHGYDNVLVFAPGYMRSNLPLLLCLVDLVVVPSLNESYGLVKRECEALGVPVIATSAGGLGGSVKAGDAKALATAIQEFIDA